MKIKRKRYNELIRIANTQFKLFAGDDSPLMDLTFEHLALVARFRGIGPDDTQYFTGTFRIEVTSPCPDVMQLPAEPYGTVRASETGVQPVDPDMVSDPDAATSTGSGKTENA
jgi:hypothetical protein